MRILTALLAVLLCSGCFVVDEIEKGRAIMKAHAPESEPEVTRKAGGGAPASARQRLAEYYAEQRAKASPASRSDDPGDAVGRCRIRGSTEFLRRADCRIRGGTFL
jgi:hypothetical protein